MVKKIANLKGQVDCEFCFSLLEWDSIEDVKWSNGNRYIVCPVCKKHVILKDNVDYWVTGNGGDDSQGGDDTPSGDTAVVGTAVVGTATAG